MPGFPSGFGVPGNGPLFFPPTESAVDLPLVDDDNDGWWSGIAAFTQVALTTALLAANASAQLAQPSQGPAWDQGEIAAAAPLGGTVSGELIIRPIAWANAPLHWNDGNEFVAVASFAVDQSDYAVPGPWPVSYTQPWLYDPADVPIALVPALDDGDWNTPQPWPLVPPSQPSSGDAEGVQLYAVPEDHSQPRYDVWPFVPPSQPVYDAGEIAYIPPIMVEFGEWGPPPPWPVITLFPPPSGDAEGVQLYAVPDDTAPPRFDVWPTIPPQQPVADEVIVPQPPVVFDDDPFRPPPILVTRTTWLLHGTSGPTGVSAPPPGPLVGDDDALPPVFWTDLAPHVLPAPWAWHSGNDVPNGLPEEPEWRTPTIWTLSGPRVVWDTDEWVPVQVLNPEQETWQNWVAPKGSSLAVPAPFGWEQHDPGTLVVFPLPPDEDFYRAGPESVPPVVSLPVWGYEQYETAQLSTLTDGDYVLVIPPPRMGQFSVPAPWQWEQDPAFVSIVLDEDRFSAGPQVIPPLVGIPVYAYDQHERIQQAAGPTEDHWQNSVRPVGLTFRVPSLWAGEQLEQSSGLVVAHPLLVQDRSAYRYGVLDQSGNRYIVTDRSGIRYDAEEGP